MKKKVGIGLSGGIDSSVAAYLLKKKGYDLIGFTLKFFPQDNRCCDTESLYQAKRLCHRLDIPHYVLDAGEVFEEEIINYFIKSYLEGQTPNPCAWCNRLIKFGYFLEKIRSFNLDYLATGHYAGLGKRRGKYFFKVNKDPKKSQEYFLSLVEPSILKNLIFPLANYTKDKVRKIAQDNDIIFVPRKESQDVCFINDKSYPEFIEENIANPGDYSGVIRHINGKALKQHQGIFYYTYGQRSGLGIGWPWPLYVNSIDPVTKDVIVGEREFLKRGSFSVKSLNWFLAPDKFKKIRVKIRYNSPFRQCRLKIESDKVLVSLQEQADGITPGQVAAFYHKDILLGGGIIEGD